MRRTVQERYIAFEAVASKHLSGATINNLLAIMTPSEFWKLQDRNLNTDLQRNANWTKHIAGETIAWVGKIALISRGIINNGPCIRVEVTVDLGHHREILGFCAPIDKLDYYLTFSPNDEVTVSGMFAEDLGGSFGHNGFPVVNGMVEHTITSKR